MKNKTIVFFIIILILVVGGYVFANNKNGNSNVIVNNGQSKGEAQKIILSQNDLNYNDITANAGNPLLISADSSVRGCLRSVVFNINNKKYSKYLRSNEDTLELPGLSKGTYTFSCSMGMGYGKLIVK